MSEPGAATMRVRPAGSEVLREPWLAAERALALAQWERLGRERGLEVEADRAAVAAAAQRGRRFAHRPPLVSLAAAAGSSTPSVPRRS